jgi:hypothetical protein
MLTHLARWGAALAACTVAVSLAGVSVAALGGCSAQCSSSAPGCQQPTATGARDDLICVKDAQTGSHIAESRCYRRSDLDERRESDRAILEKAQMSGNRPVGNKRDQ